MRIATHSAVVPANRRTTRKQRSLHRIRGSEPKTNGAVIASAGEAIQCFNSDSLDCFVALLLAMTPFGADCLSGKSLRFCREQLVRAGLFGTKSAARKLKFRKALQSHRAVQDRGAKINRFPFSENR